MPEWERNICRRHVELHRQVPLIANGGSSWLRMVNTHLWLQHHGRFSGDSRTVCTVLPDPEAISRRCEVECWALSDAAALIALALLRVLRTRLLFELRPESGVPATTFRCTLLKSPRGPASLSRSAADVRRWSGL